MNRFQRFVIELIGLSPELYNAESNEGHWGAVRNISDSEMKMIDYAFECEIKKPNSPLYSYIINRKEKIKASELIIHLIKNCK